MLKNIAPTTTNAWQKLQAHFSHIQPQNLRDLFANDPERFQKLSLQFEDFLFDLSKNRITDETLDLLVNLAEEMELPAAIESMFRGEKINVTEDRAVLHTALRNFTDNELLLGGEDILQDVRQVQQQMKTFCDKIHDGTLKGYTGKPFKHIVNIGIGG